jgi:hypothetical protein
MVKTGVLETISYKQKRVKFNGQWFTVDPFISLDNLKFGESYNAEFKQEKGLGLYIAGFTQTEG